jgi:hypothetical protein
MMRSRCVADALHGLPFLLHTQRLMAQHAVADSWLPPSCSCASTRVQVQPMAVGARNYSQCDSMLIGDRAGANTYPYIQVGVRGSAEHSHEAWAGLAAARRLPHGPACAWAGLRAALQQSHCPSIPASCSIHAWPKPPEL